VYGEKADRANFVTAARLAGKVREEFERAVRLSPNDVDARLDLAEFYAEAPTIVGGGEQKARAQAQSIAALNPAREHWVYARIAEEKKDAATAEREYRQYIDLSHGDAEAWLNLALFLRRQKRFDEMEQAIVKLSQAPMPKPDVLVEAAGILYSAGRSYPFAAELLHRYLNAGPVEAAPAFKAHYLLASCWKNKGTRQAQRRSIALPWLWPGTSARPSKRSTELPTDGLRRNRAVAHERCLSGIVILSAAKDLLFAARRGFFASPQVTIYKW